MKTNPYLFRTALVFLAMLYLAGCSGDNTQLAGGAGGTGISHGVMTKGSVIVNGVRYDDTNANISIDDTPKTALNLQSGMVVSVRGTIDDTGPGGTAQQVVAQSEVRGVVTAVFSAENPPRIVVLGQNVLIDDQTILNDITRPTLDTLVDTVTVVEVHGLRDTQQNIRATRVEVNPNLMGGISTMDEIRGVVTLRANATDMLFNVGTQAVDATIAPVGGTFSDGSIVEVHCTARPCIVGGVFQASLVEVEDNVNLPGVGERFETEGLVSGFSISNPNNFFLNGTPVKITATTTFRGGIKSDLLNDIKVEAEGTWNGTTLTARKIEFKRTVVRLQGEFIAPATTNNTFTLNVVGASINIEKDEFTTGAVPLVSATCVQVRGQRKAGTGNTLIVTAGQIIACDGGDNHLIQAPVEMELGTTLTLLGVNIDIGNPTNTVAPYRDFNGIALTQTQFLAAVSPASDGPPAVAGTLVKIRFNAGATTVTEVELED